MDEYDHMKALRGAPHIATLHDGLEFNRKTKTLSFFMDYYRGKDLDRQVQMLRGAAERFSESQIVEIGYQIAIALELCHSMNILHQDIKPMNVLLKQPWNPMTQQNVPDLFVADFGIAAQVPTLTTRITGGRGTPGYEAPEIRGYQAAFSQKSDVYAFGCILYRLCTLEDPAVLDDLKPMDITGDYSMTLISLVSSMLSSERDKRPTASQVKGQLATIAREMFPAEVETTAIRCQMCRNIFPSLHSLSKHARKKGHDLSQVSKTVPLANRVTKDESAPPVIIENIELQIRGAADAPPTHHHDDDIDGENEVPPPCVVCWKGYDSKQKLFRHLYCDNHTRSPHIVLKRLADIEDAEEANKRQRA